MAIKRECLFRPRGMLTSTRFLELRTRHNRSKSTICFCHYRKWLRLSRSLRYHWSIKYVYLQKFSPKEMRPIEKTKVYTTRYIDLRCGEGTRHYWAICNTFTAEVDGFSSFLRHLNGRGQWKTAWEDRTAIRGNLLHVSLCAQLPLQHILVSWVGTFT